MKKYFGFFMIALLTSVLTVGAVKLLDPDTKEVIIQQSAKPEMQVVQTSATAVPAALDFTYAAEESTPAVVHIRSTVVQANQPNINDEFFRFFGQPLSPRQRKSQSSGSGVIISKDGYIVTNNHVVQNAEQIEITLWNKNTYTAELIGTDPSTDLAVIKVDADDLPFLSMANSNNVKVGEWVLAVGNPFNLESTVTAGIISAKGRNINILRDQYSIESFIQTDAAVNPGNSGGALVDLSGNLIGINTAIATPTGTYAGYSFAVPSNIVQKVSEDLIQYGIVQRGFLGVMIRSVDGNVADELGLKVNAGVYVDKLVEKGSAKEYGIEKGDVIVEIDGKTIKATPELQEAVGSKRPGDVVNIVVNRDGKEKSLKVILKNKEGNTDIIEKEVISAVAVLGVKMKALEQEELNELKIRNGVRVEEIEEGRVKRDTRMREGFIITRIDGKTVTTPEDVEAILSNKKGGVMIEGIYPGVAGKTYYAVGM